MINNDFGKKRIGYWRQQESDTFSDLPWPKPSRLPKETKDLVVAFLKEGKQHTAYMGWSNCRLCNKMNGTVCLTNGGFIYPEGYAHYIEDHDVEPDIDLIGHVLSTYAASKLPPDETEGRGAGYYLKLKKLKEEKKLEEQVRRQKVHDETFSCCGNLKTEKHRLNCVNADGELGFKNRFVQHVPSFFTLEDSDYFTLNFNDQDELLKTEYVNAWTKHIGFSQFSISPKDHYCAASLMVEYHYGVKWLCVGYIKNMDGITLPKWNPVYEKDK